MKTTTNTYKSFLFKYGIIPLLLVNDFLEENEFYEECGKLIGAIVEVNHILKKDRLPVKFSNHLKLDIEWTIVKMGLDIENAYSIIQKSQLYKGIILEELGF